MTIGTPQNSEKKPEGEEAVEERQEGEENEDEEEDSSSDEEEDVSIDLGESNDEVCEFEFPESVSESQRRFIQDKFLVDSNEVLHMKLVRSTQDLGDDSKAFKPEMSHQVFGKSEQIFGYDGLKIDLYYTAGFLKVYVNIKYDEVIDQSVIGVRADDLTGIIARFLEHEFFENVDLFAASLKEELKFKPFGELISSSKREIDNESKSYEIYHANVSNVNDNFLAYYNRVQRFLIWYIDCANYIDLDDDKWNCFIMYEKYKTDDGEMAYGIVGFCTVYEYYAYPSHIRPRISQILILPPYQKQGLAVSLVDAIYKHYINDDQVIDITVEGATEEFQLIRDYIDLCRCEKLESFATENLKNGFTKQMEEEARNKLKIHKGQARRIHEIMTLNMISKANEEEYKKFRLKVKSRLNRPYQNMGTTIRKMKNSKSEAVKMAAMLDTAELRIAYLSKIYENLEKQYERAINRWQSRPLTF